MRILWSLAIIHVSTAAMWDSLMDVELELSKVHNALIMRQIAEMRVVIASLERRMLFSGA
jgi:hypothetical protein